MADAQKGDLLDMARINALPQPLIAVDRAWRWPIYDIDVQTGQMRIDVCGLLQIKDITDYPAIEDAHGVLHDPYEWYLDTCAMHKEVPDAK